MGGHIICHEPIWLVAGVKYIASCSFGKDSLAMVLRLIEEKYPLDEVVFYDTGMEFQAIYNNKEKLSNILLDYNIKFTVLKDTKSFEFKAFEKEIHKRDGTIEYGYDWCGGVRRWETKCKTNIIKKYLKEVYLGQPIVEYIGVAFDEYQRLYKSRIRRWDTAKIYPLVEWQMTEEDCLIYCREHGWNWEEDGVDLYNVLDRVSCWCCSNKNQKEIRNIIMYLPKYWERIKQYENRCGVPYKGKGCTYYEQKLMR